MTTAVGRSVSRRGFWTAGAAPARLAAIGQTLIEHPYDAWSFGDSIGFEALLEYGRRFDPGAAGFVQGYLRGWAARRSPFVRLDCTAPGMALVKCYEDTGDAALLQAAVELADYLASRPRIGSVFETWTHSPLQRPYGPQLMDPIDVDLLARRPAGSFVDCLHFDPPFFASLGVALADDTWVDLAVEQAKGYVDLLQQADGLFDHFVLRDVAGSFGRAWGRGQGWAALGLLDVIARLTREDQRRAPLADSVVKLLLAMGDSQREDGHWAAVVDDQGGATETSTAAFMAVAGVRAQRLHLSVPAGMTERAREAVQRDLRADGVLPGVSAAVNASTVDAHYRHVPTGFVVPWGQGPALLAELAGMEENAGF